MHFSVLVVGEINQLEEFKDNLYDYYTVGGRWADHLILKDGSKVDVARYGDIDWVAMEGEERSKKNYQKILKEIGKNNYKERLSDLKMWERNQATLSEIPTDQDDLFSYMYKEMDEAEFIESCNRAVFHTVIKDGEAYDFGALSRTDTKKELLRILSEVGADEELTVVDCHS